jgi:hypothetical protein
MAFRPRKGFEGYVNATKFNLQVNIHLRFNNQVNFHHEHQNHSDNLQARLDRRAPAAPLS